jgi:hypothetical protein
MDDAVAIIIIINTLFMLMMIRIHNTFVEIKGVLKIISVLSNNDINSGRPWQWRYDRFDEVSDWKVILMPWRSVTRHYHKSLCENCGRKNYE